MHRTSLDFLQAISQQGDELFAPALLFPEIAGAMARPTRNPEWARGTIALIKATINIREIAVDQGLSGRAADIAAKYFLRGADAIYVALSQSLGTILITLDKEMLKRNPDCIDYKSSVDCNQ